MKLTQSLVDVALVFEGTELEVDSEPYKRLLENVYSAEGICGPAQASLVFVDEALMAKLNLEYRSKDYPTDVLSFAIDDLSDEQAELIGDIIICPSVARENAKGNGNSFIDELALLVVHGALHLLGMDHEDDSEALVMEERERGYLGQFWGADTKTAILAGKDVHTHLARAEAQ
jgi:probable rRNA maturation factor